MSGGSRALARRYARALLQAAGADALALREELRAFAPLVEGHSDLRRALLDPARGTEPRRRLVAAVAEAAGASPVLRRLLDLLVVRDRLGLLPTLVEVYAEVANAAHGILSAEVVSAAPLAEDQRRGVDEALGGKVELRCRVDPGLVGGVLLRVAGTTYDGSVRTRLAALRQRLASPGPGAPAGAS